MQFDSIDTAIQRMLGCVLRYKEEPVRVQHVYDSKSASFSFLGVVRDRIDISFNDPDLDYTPVPLGNMNIRGTGCFYFVRVPLRAWRVGLHPDNYRCLNGKYNPFRATVSLRRTIVGEYPNIEEAISLSKKNGHRIAFHRYLSLYGDDLVYKTRKVGKIREDGEFFLFRQHEFLNEYIKEMIDEVL